MSGPPSPVPAGPVEREFPAYEGPGSLAHLGARLRRNPTLLAGIAFLGLFGVAAAGAIYHYGAARDLMPVDPSLILFFGVPPGPSAAHPFGMDAELGVDVFSGLWRATPNDLAVVGGILLLAATIGLLLGGWIGYRGGWLDHLAVGLADLLVGVPPFFFVIVLFLGVAPLEPSADGLPIFVGLFGAVLWPYYLRPVRVVAQQTAAAPYVESARAAGAGADRILFRHILPNSLYPVLAQLPIDVFNVFFVLSVFPFIACFGGGTAFASIAITPSPLYPEWGSLLAYGACYGWSPATSLDAWWSFTFPAATIVLFGLMVVLLCDGLERHLGGPSRR